MALARSAKLRRALQPLVDIVPDLAMFHLSVETGIGDVKNITGQGVSGTMMVILRRRFKGELKQEKVSTRVRVWDRNLRQEFETGNTTGEGVWEYDGLVEVHDI